MASEINNGQVTGNSVKRHSGDRNKRLNGPETILSHWHYITEIAGTMASELSIDCPEMGQEFGEKAKMLLEKLVLNKSVNAEIQGKDRWGNRLGIVLIDGKDPREELLEQGLAWTAERNPIESLEAIKEKSKQRGTGLWKEQDPTPPWVYRRQQTMTQVKSS